jgi:hypothetical protein
MPVDPLLKQFMPSSPAPPKPRTKATSANPQTADREADPAIRRARELCDYADKILEDIYKDYEIQIADWETQFGEVLTALNTAVENRRITLEKAS